MNLKKDIGEKKTHMEENYGIPVTRRRRNEIMLGFAALEMIFAFSYLGFIVIPPISITTMHILVVIAAMTLGTRESVVVSLVFVLSSVWQATVSGVQYSDVIFSPFVSRTPLRSLLLQSARLLFGWIAGAVFSLYFRKQKKPTYVGVGVTALVATWSFGTLTYLFLALLFPEAGVSVSDAFLAWMLPENLVMYVVTFWIVLGAHWILSRKWLKKTFSTMSTGTARKMDWGRSAYYIMGAVSVILCVIAILHLISRIKLVMSAQDYLPTFVIRSNETQLLLQFFCAFIGILLLLYLGILWLGEYRAARQVSRQKESDAAEKLKAEQKLNKKLLEQNAELAHQKRKLKEAVDAAEYSRKEARKAEEEARAASAAKSVFLSRMTHDIRTPLNGIIGLLKINDRHPEDVKLLQENRAKMEISADYLLSLINDMLEMSKLEEGSITLAREVMDLNQLSRDVLTIVGQRAAEAGVTIDFDRSPEKVIYPYVYGSPIHLRQLFLNIYSNGIKYNEVGGRVDTHFECLGVSGGKVTYRWTISDTGIGMSPEFLAHIFEPFSQERTDARSVYQGTGLGMAIVKGLVEKMGGTIEVSSQEGKGSVFVIVLPFEIAEKPEEATEQKKETAEIRGFHLLLVEDNELNAEIARTLLTEEGAEVELVENGKEALERYRSTPAGTYDAILMDVMMPVMDGLTATRMIRAEKRPDAATIPIIAMTANAFVEDAAQCLEAGMNAHLSKPLQMEKVVETIAKCCKK